MKLSEWNDVITYAKDKAYTLSCKYECKVVADGCNITSDNYVIKLTAYDDLDNLFCSRTTDSYSSPEVLKERIDVMANNLEKYL